MMIEWINVGDSLPQSDDHVLVKTNKNAIYSAYFNLEHVPEDESVWKRTWLSNLNSAEIDDYLDMDEQITHWQPLPK